MRTYFDKFNFLILESGDVFFALRYNKIKAEAGINNRKKNLWTIFCRCLYETLLQDLKMHKQELTTKYTLKFICTPRMIKTESKYLNINFYISHIICLNMYISEANLR